MVDLVNPALAAKLYQNAQTGAKAPGIEPEPGVRFDDMMRNAVTDSVATLRKGEQMSAQAVTGKADLTDVVAAVSDAEMTLQTVVAVRDRMLNAYQEIMRMPI